MSVVRATAAVMALGVVLASVGATTSPAIVGGHVVSRSTYPWFVRLSDSCAAVLVRPSRLVTSASCVNEDLLTRGDRIHIAHSWRRVVAIANHPGWVRHEMAYADACQLSRDCRYSGDLVGIYCRPDMVCPNDLALIAVDRPVSRIRLPRIAPPHSGLRTRALGAGETTNDIDDGDLGGDERLRAAALEIIGDRRCAAAYRRAGRSWLRAFDAQSMLCGWDPSPPRTAAICSGDSGGPLVGRGRTGWRLYGIASWNKDCGAGGWPSVFSDIWRYRSFVLSRRPTWLPAMTGHPRITGVPAVGRTLTCTPPKIWAPADETIFTFISVSEEDIVRQRGASQRYTVQDGDRGSAIGCRIETRNSGGISVALTDLDRDVDVIR
jgi:hypothetical protein